MGVNSFNKGQLCAGCCVELVFFHFPLLAAIVLLLRMRESTTRTNGRYDSREGGGLRAPPFEISYAVLRVVTTQGLIS